MSSKGKGREVNISLAIQRSAVMSGKGKEVADYYDIDKVPDDVWLFLFEYLTTPDLNALSRVSKKFYALTQRPLLRELTWAKATGASRNVQDWGDGAVLESFRGVVRKVNVKLSYKKVNQNSALLLPVDWELFDSVHHRLLSFSNLRSLELQNTIITPALYQVLEAIPSLRELSIIRCTFVWTYIYFPLLTNLGRQAPNPGLFIYNNASRNYHPQHGMIRAPSDPVQRAAQQAWLLENTVFDFAARLSHITSLNLQCNRFTNSSETDDLPYPPTEISRPSILHPLYLLSIRSLTNLTLTWTPTLAQIYETLKQSFNFSQPAAGGAHNAAHHHHLANLLFAANTLDVNLFTPLVIKLSQLTHATLVIDDLSRDMMESIAGLFDQRIHHAPAGIPPLRIHLKVGKHTLTEQNMGATQFRLPGVYKYEGPLPIASLLMADSASDMEEVYMNESMEMSVVLLILERLPRTLKKLHLRLYTWDREILYAVHSLFKQLQEFVVRFGKGSLEENTFVVLGSDILPDMQQLHTIKLIPSSDCVKRDQQFRSYHHSPHHHHHHHHHPHFYHFHNNGWHGGGGPGGPGGHGMPDLGGAGTHLLPAAGAANPVTTTSAAPPPPTQPSFLPVDDYDLADLMHDDFYDYEEDDEFDYRLAMRTRRRVSFSPANAFGGLSTSASNNAQVASPSAVTSSSASANANAESSTMARDRSPIPQSRANARRSSLGEITRRARSFTRLTDLSESDSEADLDIDLDEAEMVEIVGSRATSRHQRSIDLSRYNTRAEHQSLLSAAPPRSSNSAADASSSTVTASSSSSSSHAGASAQTQASSSSGSNASPPVSLATSSPTNAISDYLGRGPAGFASSYRSRASAPLVIRDRSSRRPPIPAVTAPTANEAEGTDERRRIALSLEEDLEDYLVGWNRHCRNLRVVQMEAGFYWVRRFEGDRWTRMKATSD